MNLIYGKKNGSIKKGNNLMHSSNRCTPLFNIHSHKRDENLQIKQI